MVRVFSFRRLYSKSNPTTTLIERFVVVSDDVETLLTVSVARLKWNEKSESESEND